MLAYLKQNPTINELLTTEMHQYLAKNEKVDFMSLMGCLRPIISKLTYEENPMCGIPKLKNVRKRRAIKDKEDKVALFTTDLKSTVVPEEKSILEEFFKLNDLPNIKKRKRNGERVKDLKKQQVSRKKLISTPESISETIDNVCKQVYR